MSAAPVQFEDLEAPPLAITTDRLQLRRVTKADAPRFAELLNNFAVAGNLARVALPQTADHVSNWLNEITDSKNPASFGFAVSTDADGVIGYIGFHERDPGNVQIGYWLGEPYWGRGYMTEAVTAAIGWFFNHSDHQVLGSGVFHFNMASLAIQYKLGFVEIGRSHYECLARNEVIEHIDTELARDEFEANRR